jgi:hypothetical protein
MRRSQTGGWEWMGKSVPWTIWRAANGRRRCSPSNRMSRCAAWHVSRAYPPQQRSTCASVLSAERSLAPRNQRRPRGSWPSARARRTSPLPRIQARSQLSGRRPHPRCRLPQWRSCCATHLCATTSRERECYGCCTSTPLARSSYRGWSQRCPPTARGSSCSSPVSTPRCGTISPRNWIDVRESSTRCYPFF